ncbi:MAG: hypothetical protein WAM97_20630 [Acidimicrobiales bacterium]
MNHSGALVGLLATTPTVILLSPARGVNPVLIADSGAWATWIGIAIATLSVAAVVFVGWRTIEETRKGTEAITAVHEATVKVVTALDTVELTLKSATTAIEGVQGATEGVQQATKDLGVVSERIHESLVREAQSKHLENVRDVLVDIKDAWGPGWGALFAPQMIPPELATQLEKQLEYFQLVQDPALQKTHDLSEGSGEQHQRKELMEAIWEVEAAIRSGAAFRLKRKATS